MTITINPIFIYCWAFIIVFETIHGIILWKRFCKKLKKKKYEFFLSTVDAMKKSFAGIRLAHKKIFNPFNYFVLYILFCIMCPFFFLSSLKSIFKKIIGYKSKLEIQVAEEERKFEEAQKASEEFMRNEGVYMDTSDIEFEEKNN
jgi:hypothetical protein